MWLISESDVIWSEISLDYSVVLVRKKHWKMKSYPSESCHHASSAETFWISLTPWVCVKIRARTFILLGFDLVYPVCMSGNFVDHHGYHFRWDSDLESGFTFKSDRKNTEHQINNEKLTNGAIIDEKPAICGLGAENSNFKTRFICHKLWLIIHSWVMISFTMGHCE